MFFPLITPRRNRRLLLTASRSRFIGPPWSTSLLPPWDRQGRITPEIGAARLGLGWLDEAVGSGRILERILPPGHRRSLAHVPVRRSRPFALSDQAEGSKEESPDLLIPGLTRLCLPPPTEFGSALPGADPLPGFERLAANGTAALADVRLSPFDKRTCGFWRELRAWSGC
jgi:hypothetical protein